MLNSSEIALARWRALECEQGIEKPLKARLCKYKDKCASMQAAFDSQELGARLCALREELGYSQADFASRLGISLRAYQSYERAERELPLTAAVALFKELGINPIWLTLGNGAGSKKLLTPEDSARLCAELHETWQLAVDALPVEVAHEVSKPIYRRLSRSTFREAAVPQSEINEAIEDLKP